MLVQIGAWSASISNSTLKVTAAKYLLHDAILQLSEIPVLAYFMNNAEVELIFFKTKKKNSWRKKHVLS